MGLHATQPLSAPPPLAALIKEGLSNNGKIKSLEAEVAGLEEEIQLAASLDNPRLGLGLLNLPVDTFNFNQEPMTQKQVFIAQKFPWFGKLTLRKQQAALKALRRGAILETERIALARQIATTYYDLGFIISSQDTNRRLSGMVGPLIRIAETAYGTGRGLQQDVLQAQVTMSTLLDEKIALDGKHRTLQDKINELLNRTRFTPVPFPAKPPFPDLHIETTDLQVRALQYNPSLKLRAIEIEEARVSVELARADYWTDIDVRLSYGQRDSNRTGQDWADFFSASVVLDLPLWYKTRQDKKLAAARKNHEAATHAYRNLKDSLPHAVDALATEVRTIRENYRLLTEALLIQAEQLARSSLTAYKVGKVEFDTMINAWIRLLKFERQADSYLFSIYKKTAELDELLGYSPAGEQALQAADVK
jgi:cobalt-zinc-cadmium efflux system outer membrane protein